MNFNDQISRYFGASELSAVSPEVLKAGIERMIVDLGLAGDPGERFALWSLLYTLGSAPDPQVVFETEADRDAVRNFVSLFHGVE